jgi:hypothetical protein
MPDTKSDEDNNVRPGISWPERVHLRAHKLAHEHGFSLSEYLSKLVNREWEDPSMPPPIDLSPGLQKLIRQAEKLRDDSAKFRDDLRDEIRKKRGAK